MPTSGQLFLIVAVLLTFYYINGKGIESFASAVPVEVTLDEYAQDIRVLASYVGPYIGEIYTYLRTMYSDASQNTALPIFYQPTSDDDPTLKDPLLAIARKQVKSWIDSSKAQMLKRYGDAFINSVKSQNDLRYETQSSGVLHIVLVQNGQIATFIL